MLNKLRMAYWTLSGRTIDIFMQEKTTTGTLTRSELDDLQLRKLKKVLINAYENVPFYQKKFKEIGFEPHKLNSLEEFNSLDFYITKEDVRNHSNDFINPKARKSDLSWHRTGGSTGTPLLFATDKLTDSGSQTSIMRALKWFGTEFGRKHVIFWGSPSYVVRNRTDILKKILTVVRDKLMSRMYISNYDLSPSNMDHYFRKIEKFKPEYIRGMSSSLYIFAKHMIDNKLEFSDSNLKVIHSACEQLFDWQKEVIEKAFNTPVANTYGLSEVCDIAYGAPCGHLHVSDEDVLLEIHNTDIGGELIATQLNNLSCPLIRYRTNDLADKIKSTCSFSPTSYIEGIKGRAHDVIKTSDGRFIHGQAFTHIMVFVDTITNYQIVQKTYTSFDITLVVDMNYQKNIVEKEILGRVQKLIENNITVEFNYVSAIPLTPSGKHRWIISNV